MHYFRCVTPVGCISAIANLVTRPFARSVTSSLKYWVKISPKLQTIE